MVLFILVLQSKLKKVNLFGLKEVLSDSNSPNGLQSRAP